MDTKIGTLIIAHSPRLVVDSFVVTESLIGEHDCFDVTHLRVFVPIILSKPGRLLELKIDARLTHTMHATTTPDADNDLQEEEQCCDLVFVSDIPTPRECF